MSLFTWINQKVLEKKLKNGDVEAAYELAHFYLSNTMLPDYSKIAIDYLVRAARGNIVKAQHELAEYYIKGEYVQQNIRTAMYWFLRAADNGSTDGWNSLLKIEENLEQKDVFDWYRLFDNQNSRHAYMALGNYYCNGIEGYIQVDYKTASELYLKAFNNGTSADKLPLENISRIGAYFYEKEKDYIMAFYWCKLASELGSDPLSEYYVGKCYFDGTGTKIDFKESVRYFESAMNKGITDSKLYLGQCYMQGFGGVAKDPERALTLFKDIYSSHPEVYNHIGNYYLEKDNMQNAAVVFEKADEAGVATESNDGFYKIALYYDKIQDYKKAIYWLNLSSKGNSEEGFFLMSQYLFYGKHYKKDVEKAIESFYKLADMGYHPALQRMYDLYDKGEDTIKPNKEKAFSMLMKLAEAGDVDAIKNVGNAYMQNDSNLVGQNYELAASWYDKWYKHHQKSGSIEADYLSEVGDYYYNNKKYESANRWFLRAVDRGAKDAYVRLGLIARMNGKADNDKAFKYFSEAANANISTGMAYLAKCYYNGIGVNVDYTLAYKYFSMAAEREDSGGLYGQAFCLLNSIGMKPTNEDSTKAFNLLCKAAEKKCIDAYELLADCYELGIGTEASIDKAIYYWFLRKNNKELIGMIEKKDYHSLYEYLNEKKEDLYYKMILTYFGKGTIEDKDAACEMYVTCFRGTPLKNICGNNATRAVFKYRIAADVIKAGIGYERDGNSERAITYYKAAFKFNPKAGILLARILFDGRECDSLPLLKIMAQWKEKDRIYKKSKSIANYMLGLYYEYFYSKVTKPRTQYTNEYEFPTMRVQNTSLMMQYYMESSEDEAYRRIC